MIQACRQSNIVVNSVLPTPHCTARTDSLLACLDYRSDLGSASDCLLPRVLRREIAVGTPHSCQSDQNHHSPDTGLRSTQGEGETIELDFNCPG